MPLSAPTIVTAVEAAAFPAPPDWPALDPSEAARHGADLSLVLRDGDGGEPLRGRCSLWWTDAPPLAGETLGVVGHFGATDAEAAHALLDAACVELARRGCTLAAGPMDGNTWRRYRLVTEPGEEPPFFLEPTNPPAWPAWWEEAGWTPLAHYFSALAEDLTVRDPRAERVAERLASIGVTIRPIDPARFEAELDAIYDVSAVSFRDNYLYTPLARDEFVAQYAKVRPLVVPELAMIAEHEGRAVGFGFSLPDASERMRGAPARTIIVKTLAILPERRLYGGLGSLITDRTQATAHAMGFTRAIHALMHESNASLAISARTARRIRRYALYGRTLDAGR